MYTTVRMAEACCTMLIPPKYPITEIYRDSTKQQRDILCTIILVRNNARVIMGRGDKTLQRHLPGTKDTEILHL